jgi:ABC-type sugar transport system ATPase subunit
MGKERSVAREQVKAMSIKIGSLDHPVSSLSGGNQQKVVIAKWLPANPKVVLLDDPTKGVDVGAKAEIYSIVRALTEQGVAVLFNSSDDIELEELADRVLVMYEGNIVDELVGEQITHSALVAAALRVDEDPEEMPA